MKVSIGNEHVQVKIDLNGAQLRSVCCHEHEYLWQGDKQYWEGQAPLLFPAIGSYEKNQIRIRGQLCEMDNHGFLKDMIFQVVEHEPAKVTLRATYNEETLQQYPYKFEVEVVYEVTETSMESTYVVRNLDEENMVYNFGLHPALNCNVGNENVFEDYYVEFEEQRDIDSLIFNDNLRIELDKTRRIQSDTKKLELKHDMFYRTIIMTDIDFQHVWLGHKEEGRYLKFAFDGFDVFAMWQPVGAPFVCLEPWNGIDGIVQDFENLEESSMIQSLSVGGEKEYKMKMEFL